MLIKDGDKEYFVLFLHEFWMCPNCKEVYEVCGVDRENGQMHCDKCGCSLEFEDDRFKSWEEEY